MASKRKLKKRLSAGSHGRNTPMQAKVACDPIKVQGYKQFHEQAERLRNAGMFEMPDAFGGGSGHGSNSGIDYGDYINAKLSCEATAGSAGKGQLPLLHVSSGYAQPVTAENGHKGSYITWGAGNRIPNVVSFLCSLSPYTAAALKFNIDLITGMGPKPMYQYSQYVGGNLLNKQISYEYAGTLLKGWKIDLLRQLSNLKKDSAPSGSSAGNSGAITTTDRVLGGTATEETSEYEQALRDRLAEIEADLAVWEQTMAELKVFQQHNNLLQTFQQLYADMLQYNICYPEIELQQTYIDPDTKHEVQSFKWNPKAVGIKYRNAKTIRLEQMDNQNKINYVYVSNQWLSSPEQTVFTQDSDFKIDAIPAINHQSPSADLDNITRKARQANVSKADRPTHVVLPIRYNEYGHTYYPVPAWYSVFSGDVYTYASILISDRNKRRQNSNVIGRIIYLNNEYMERQYFQAKADTNEDKLKVFNAIRNQINSFLEDRDNTGKPLVAYTFLGSDGKVYKSWEIVELEENNKATAEANKEELAEISSIILFAWGVDSQLIGNTPGTTTRSGGTDLRERYLLKQVNMSLMQQLVLNVMDVFTTRNHWDSHLTWKIQREVLTTLDNSKTGITNAENNA